MQSTSKQRRKLLQTAGAVLAAPFFAHSVLAQDRFPRGRPVTLISPWAPGGIGDVTARRVAQGLTSMWGVQVTVDNKAGANGNIGAAAVTHAPPDGYTLVLTLDDGLITGRAARFQMGFDPLTDLTALARIGVSDIYWTLKGDSAIKNIGEFVAYAKANPNKLNFGSNGIGSSPHLALELLNNSAGIKITHVPFRGGAQAVPELLASRIDALMATPALALQHYRTGTMKPIAVVGSTRSPLYPDLPTIAESGFPDVAISIGVGLFGPKGMSRALVEQINQDVRNFVTNAEVKARFVSEGFAISTMSATEYQAFLVKDVARMEPLVKRINFHQS